ncbi:hypothetical protein D3C87_1824250 [compost metagenome]
MLDNTPIHINHIQCAIRAIIQTNRPEALILAGQKFFTLVSLPATHNKAFLLKNIPFDQVCRGLSHKSVEPVSITK